MYAIKHAQFLFFFMVISTRSAVEGWMYFIPYFPVQLTPIESLYYLLEFSSELQTLIEKSKGFSGFLGYSCFFLFFPTKLYN